MNESTIFIVGIIIFAITIYGTVMAGGIALTNASREQEPERTDGASVAPEAPLDLP